MIRPALCLLTLFASVPVSIAAAQSERLSFQPGVSQTKVSGHTGKVLTVGTASDRHGVFGLELRARRGRLCGLTAAIQSLTPSAAKPFRSELSLCPGKRKQRRKRRGKWVGFANPRMFIRGISICTTDDEDSSRRRLRGVKLYGARVTPDGAVRSESSETLRKRGCAMWHKARFCPSGQIAVKVRAHARDGVFRGLALECRRLRAS